LYATYSDAKEDPTMVVESHAPKKTHQTQMDREELERTFEEFSKPLEGGVSAVVNCSTTKLAEVQLH
jgi:hypothetical protein